MWYKVWRGIQADFADVPSIAVLIQLTVRLLLAAMLGGILGVQLEGVGQAAGRRQGALPLLTDCGLGDADSDRPPGVYRDPAARASPSAPP